MRFDYAYLFGAVCPERAATAGLVLPCSDTAAFTLHLAEISRRVAEGAHALVITDGAPWHGAKAVVPDNLTLVKLPGYSPELNPVEMIWQYLRANRLAITVFDDYDDIIEKSCDAWNFFANDPDRVISITSREWARVNQ
jgi:transposase